MDSSLNSNSSAIPSSLVEDGQAFYESHLKSALETEHRGEFVAIEPSTACYFLGETATSHLFPQSTQCGMAILPHSGR
jgi:hypothetical protein